MNLAKGPRGAFLVEKFDFNQEEKTMKTTSDIWINPITVIKLFTRTLLSRSKKYKEILSLVKSRQLRVTVEAWRAAMYLIALSKQNGSIKHFLQDNPGNAPDFYGLDLFIKNGLPYGYIRGIEVFQYAPESNLPFIEEVKKKTDKAYDKKTVLVCQIRKKFKDKIENIHREIQKLNPRNEIWVIGGSEKDNEGDQLVCQVYPIISATTISIPEVLQQDDTPAFVKGFPPKSMEKTDSLKFEPLGKQTLLTPEFQLIEEKGGE